MYYQMYRDVPFLCRHNGIIILRVANFPSIDHVCHSNIPPSSFQRWLASTSGHCSRRLQEGYIHSVAKSIVVTFTFLQGFLLPSLPRNDLFFLAAKTPKLARIFQGIFVQPKSPGARGHSSAQLHWTLRRSLRQTRHRHLDQIWMR